MAGASEQSLVAKVAEAVEGAVQTVTSEKQPPVVPSLTGKTIIVTGGNAGAATSHTAGKLGFDTPGR